MHYEADALAIHRTRCDEPRNGSIAAMRRKRGRLCLLQEMQGGQTLRRHVHRQDLDVQEA